VHNDSGARAEAEFSIIGFKTGVAAKNLSEIALL
jgi:hypothetical protein